MFFVGTLVRRIETVEFYQRPMQSHFTLRNLSKWQERGKGKSVNDVLECVIYSTGKRRYNFSVDIHLRFVRCIFTFSIYLHLGTCEMQSYWPLSPLWIVSLHQNPTSYGE